jgi:5'-nucleotidase/UDP-sugar diphosphatase
MKHTVKHLLKALIFSLLIISCSNKEIPVSVENSTKNLTIFMLNDIHGQIDNFAKVKYLVDEEKKKTNVLLTSAGDIFSGNPIVDNYPQKGFPIIDLMNRVGFDVSVLGNHEFDYGEANLKDRMEQANFNWICANVTTDASVVPQPSPYTTITVNKLKVTFLGLVETDGKENNIIPSTHPWRVKNLTFQNPEDVVAKYAAIKDTENADLLIALTHIGFSKNGGRLGDYQLATQFPFFDVIIGGHSHSKIDEVVNNIPVFQAGSYLNYIGKIKMTITNKKVETISYELIDLNTITQEDAAIKSIIDTYNDEPFFKEVIGYSQINHSRAQVGDFTADALRLQMGVDVAFQNTGGVRANLDQGDITKKEIFQILPFNNPAVTYNMTVAEIKTFLKGSRAGLYYAGVTLEKDNSAIIVRDVSGAIIPDATILTVGMNDYIPAVYDSYFPASKIVSPKTDAETVISYLENINNQVNYATSNNYFKY